MNRVNPPDRPLNDAKRDRMDAMLSRFRSERAMNNLEEIDGFFAALICSPGARQAERIFAGNLRGSSTSSKGTGRKPMSDRPGMGSVYDLRDRRLASLRPGCGRQQEG
jgi:hypothetical protein